jgi:chromosome segregation ATPase
MKSAVQKTELKHLMRKNRKLKEQLESLEKDYHAWNEKREIDDLKNITITIKKLEVDIALAMSDFNTFTGQNEKRSEFQEDFHHGFAILNDLFENVKTIREDLENPSCLSKEKIQQMEIDWAKLKKDFETIETRYIAMEQKNSLSFF